MTILVRILIFNYFVSPHSTLEKKIIISLVIILIRIIIQKLSNVKINNSSEHNKPVLKE